MPKYSKPKQREAKKKNSLTPWFIGGGILFVALIVIAVLANGRGGTAAIAPPDIPEEWLQERLTMGNPDAVVTVEAWEDFLCPACQQWNSTIKPRLFEEYIKTGLIRLEFHQFPLQMHAPGAQMSAIATECAADQNAFWPYHDRVFQEAANRGQAGTTLDRLVDYADDLGLNTNTFRQCVTSQQHATTVNESVNEAVALGLNSTPSILINDQLMEAPFDYNALSAEIESLLDAAGIDRTQQAP